MQSKIEHLERTILELGAQVYRTKHQVDELMRMNAGYLEVFASLKKLLDDRGVISADDFEDAVAIDKILKTQASSPNVDALSGFAEELKKVVN
jgi:regulator of replication initiation timing